MAGDIKPVGERFDLLLAHSNILTGKFCGHGDDVSAEGLPLRRGKILPVVPGNFLAEGAACRLLEVPDKIVVTERLHRIGKIIIVGMQVAVAMAGPHRHDRSGKGAAGQPALADAASESGAHGAGSVGDFRLSNDSRAMESLIYAFTAGLPMEKIIFCHFLGGFYLVFIHFH